ncbi:hypothetical protein Vadar_024370 [Vaccinium darrowii]|uniref:Uncharacterized protein n=1 Tax=Vaccinium darrowii TaxID=229202 RepID=A0ACB7Y1R7_9ERIC|nr:hypothetical protein Vadar_024370 [Vaccinium darrowii]
MTKKRSRTRCYQPAAAIGHDGYNCRTNSQQEAPEKVEVEYVVEKVELFASLYNEFARIFEKFNSIKETMECDQEKNNNDALNKNDDKNEDDDSERDAKQIVDEVGVGLSRKKKKANRRIKVCELKKTCRRPDLVEVWDATAPDPKLLVFLKSYRNSVPVPRHWSYKRKYLQGKRGIEKQPFQLPDFIAATGIGKIREGYIEKEKLKQKQREKTMHPKMGRTDIDYRVLHDAFFKYQTKPNMTGHGDIYYEGKEFEVELTRGMKPGMLSQLLKEALGMTESGTPPPWLIGMQRHGPPPSYPHLKFPGVNAPIPPGASYGYHPGGWGKPPVDEYDRPLYGDVFGVQQSNQEEELVGNTEHWGDLEEQEEEDEDEVVEQNEEEEQTGEEESEADVQSFGIETPDVIDLRKRPRTDPETYLYRVLEKKEETIAPGTLLGTSHVYVVSSSGTRDKTAAEGIDYSMKRRKSDGVDVTLQPEKLEVMDNALLAKYEKAREEEEGKPRSQGEDFSGLVAENANRKRKAREKQGKLKRDHFRF